MITFQLEQRLNFLRRKKTICIAAKYDQDNKVRRSKNAWQVILNVKSCLTQDKKRILRIIYLFWGIKLACQRPSIETSAFQHNSQLGVFVLNMYWILISSIEHRVLCCNCKKCAKHPHVRCGCCESASQVRMSIQIFEFIFNMYWIWIAMF